MDNNYFLSTCKKKQTNKHITRTKTAKQLWKIVKLISETFPRSAYINSLHNSSPHLPIARYTCVLKVSTLDFQHGTQEVIFSKETSLELELRWAGKAD